MGDGDSSSFGAVAIAVKIKYGDNYVVSKEDFIGQIQKRMGSALREYKNKRRGTLLSDGKCVGGQGRLTDVVVDKIQTYFGYAIRNNTGNPDEVVKAIAAILYHDSRTTI